MKRNHQNLSPTLVLIRQRSIEKNSPDSRPTQLRSPHLGLLNHGARVGSVKNNTLSLLVLANIDADMVNLAVAFLAGTPEKRITGPDLRELDVLALFQVILRLSFMGKLGFSDFADGVKDQAYYVTELSALPIWYHMLRYG